MKSFEAVHSFKILHLATDEKFINAANFVFERAFPLSNTFLIIKGPSNPALRYVSQQSNFEIICQSRDTVELVLSRLQHVDVIVFHGLDPMKNEIFSRIALKEKVLWILWGAEVYNQSVIGSSFVGRKTEELKRKIRKNYLLECAKEIYRKIRFGNLFGSANSSFKASIFGIQNVAVLYEEELEFLKSRGLMAPDANCFPFTYYPLEFLFKDLNMRATGADILLGNSASDTNNHVEAIDMLRKVSLDGRMVYIPLSYGDSDYAKMVVSYSKQQLKESVVPLVQFMQLQDYNRMLMNCGFVIMNHYRQQAVGNVLTAIFLGAKVFLNDTTVYRFLKRIGCYVYLIHEELEKEICFPLTAEQKEVNRKCLVEEISTDVVVDKLRRAFYSNFVRSLH